MKYKLFIACLFGLHLNTLAQLKLYDVDLQFGKYIGSQKSTFDQILELTPHSSILNQDLSAYKPQKIDFFSQATPTQAIHLGFSSQKTPNVSFRFGLQHKNLKSILLNAGAYVENFDTLTLYSISGSYYQEEWSFSSALIFGLKQEKRLRFYGGLELEMGMSVNANIHLQQQKMFYTTNPSWPYPMATSFVTFTEDKKLPNTLILGLHAPIGLNIQVLKEKQYFKSIHICIEVKPGIAINNRKTEQILHQIGGTGSLGLRYCF